MRMIPSAGYIYLASPYSHPDPKVKEERYLKVLEETANFLRVGITVYSPIVHCHRLHFGYDLPGDWEFWGKHDFTMLAAAEFLYVLMLDGWKESVGVNAEVEEAGRLHIPVIYTLAGKNICQPPRM